MKNPEQARKSVPGRHFLEAVKKEKTDKRTRNTTNEKA